MSCFFKTRGLTLPFVQGLEANIASVRQMTAQWTHYAEDLATVKDIINHGGEHVFAVRNLYSLALPLSLEEHVRASSAGAAFAAKSAHDYVAKHGLSVSLDALKSIATADFGSKSDAAKRVHVCYMSVYAFVSSTACDRCTLDLETFSLATPWLRVCGVS